LELFDVKETSAIRGCATSNLQYQSVGLPRPCEKIVPHREDAKLVAIDFERFRIDLHCLHPCDHAGEQGSSGKFP
jgi:hypothetical protein